MSWHELPSWTQGIIIGALAWIVYLIVRYYQYFYVRYLIEDLGSKIQPYLFFSPPNVLSLLGIFFLCILGGALAGFLYHQIMLRVRKA